MGSGKSTVGAVLARSLGLARLDAEEARRLHIRKLMSLTYEQRFFEKLGFEVVPPVSSLMTLPSSTERSTVPVNSGSGSPVTAIART